MVICFSFYSCLTIAESSNPEPCPIDNGSEVSTIGQRGTNGINAVSTQRAPSVQLRSVLEMLKVCLITRLIVFSVELLSS